MQIAKLPGRNWRRGLGHQTSAFGGFGKSDHVANAQSTAENGKKPIEPERNSAMRRSAVPERIQEITEADLRLLRRDLQHFFKHRLLHVWLMNTNRTAPQFPAIDDDIVVLAAHFFRFSFEHRNV